jgi:hypothetical protein
MVVVAIILTIDIATLHISPELAHVWAPNI